MRPSAIFDEYEEIDFDTHIKFKGKLFMKYQQIPKSQLAFSILGNKPSTKYKIKKNGLEVQGIIKRQLVEVRGDEHEIVGRVNLTKGDVRKIRNLYEDGICQTDLSNRFKISQSVISYIITKESPYDFE